MRACGHRWDEDGGGSLDLAELRDALKKTMKEATAFNSKPDPAQQQIQRLQKRARVADEAAEAVAKADALEVELEDFSKQLESRADVRLGALLQKRSASQAGSELAEPHISRSLHTYLTTCVPPYTVLTPRLRANFEPSRRQ